MDDFCSPSQNTVLQDTSRALRDMAGSSPKCSGWEARIAPKILKSIGWHDGSGGYVGPTYDRSENPFIITEEACLEASIWFRKP